MQTQCESSSVGRALASQAFQADSRQKKKPALNYTKKHQKAPEIRPSGAFFLPNVENYFSILVNTFT
ncbi:MAG: hypothetical protein A2275_08445 [Bacteroidetes bacterium RIFOXYA12_FULL_35_11]|nr:MAG: hypothetical protein A2X01_13430 [Bacteroidetes bacterium GWF2_35_48]OFY78724.1 MAG: hypothetical protein A2275_08445 [Bacteroidetes bacterium RIFOXYA12_FULL_35_11]OFY93852.1 MAG: hypothetical protein A2491_02725 [Bacteroidetes bacterium RIFOXYC12_FULL_35_7]OFY94658.1 MAG: hypothetical protein A2309_06410 [Bacteroidetes bacterium RIFOXYB2_FULL_35_7]HBX52004.1 hypothetical protein [Bacteroidales bacterium]